MNATRESTIDLTPDADDNINILPHDDIRYPVKVRRMLTRPRQSTRNNAFLARCRKLFNDPIYKQCLSFVNDPTMTVGQGEDAARAYLLKNVVKTLDF